MIDISNNLNEIPEMPIKYYDATKGDENNYVISYQDSFDSIASKIKGSKTNVTSMTIVTDDNVAKLYLNSFIDALSKQNTDTDIQINSVIIPSGENYKNNDTINNIYKELIEKEVDRNGLLIALGGGVVGDMTGFVAATFLRGIDFVQVPTTLLAMTDSSIGGKTGIDFGPYKNMIGAFKMPLLVCINISTLDTLPEREFQSGMAEVIKSALIYDSAFYEWLNTNESAINDKNKDNLLQMIYNACNIKNDVVTKDPYEKGLRRILNFGHTIGHAIEAASGFLMKHGECVALGMIAAAKISNDKNLISENDLKSIIDTIKGFNLPTTLSIDDISADDIAKLTLNDKKMDGNKINFVLLKNIGEAYMDNTIEYKTIVEAVEKLLVG